MMVMAKQSKNILIVEDDFDIRDLLVMILNTNGYQATGVSNGQEALAHLRKAGAADLILLDLMMPIMDAWEFRERQRAEPPLDAIPVVLLSATDEVGEHVAALDAAAFLRKPIDFNALLETVGRHC